MHSRVIRQLSFVAVAVGIVLMGVGLAGATGLLRAQYIVPEAEVAGPVIAAGGIVASYLFSRARFRVEPLVSDPGSLDLERTIEYGRSIAKTDPTPRTMVLADAPGSTYPKGSQAPLSQRLPLAWGFHPLQDQLGRAFEFKFATIRVKARWNDAKRCHAVGEVFVHNGTGGTVQKGQWSPLGALNWHSDTIIGTIVKPVLREDGHLHSPVLDRIHDTPGIGLNQDLTNTEIDLNAGEEADLPLFYMRNGWPSVFLCGPIPGTSAGIPPEREPMDLEFRVRITGEKSSEKTVHFRAKAKWGDLVLTKEDEW
jgi:hypothetical protein